MQFQFLKAALHQLPCIQLLGFRLGFKGRKLQYKPFENSGCHQHCSPRYGMHECFGVIDDDSPGSDPLLEPINKPLAQLDFLTGRCG